MPLSTPEIWRPIRNVNTLRCIGNARWPQHRMPSADIISKSIASAADAVSIARAQGRSLRANPACNCLLAYRSIGAASKHEQAARRRVQKQMWYVHRTMRQANRVSMAPPAHSVPSIPTPEHRPHLDLRSPDNYTAHSATAFVLVPTVSPLECRGRPAVPSFKGHLSRTIAQISRTPSVPSRRLTPAILTIN